MICHQRQIRDARKDDHLVPDDFSTALVREIPFSEAKEVILEYEWLGNMGTTLRSFGLFFDGELAGVECFGVTGGTNVSASICGSAYADRVMTLCRGACVPWAHPHSASFLITRACNLLAEEGKNVFVAYSDMKAGEIGTVYQASNWVYCGMTGRSGHTVQSPSGRLYDERVVSNLTRDRGSYKGGPFFRRPTRAEMKNIMLRQGYKFCRDSPSIATWGYTVIGDCGESLRTHCDGVSCRIRSGLSLANGYGC